MSSPLLEGLKVRLSEPPKWQGSNWNLFHEARGHHAHRVAGHLVVQQPQKNPRETCHDLKKTVEIEIKIERLKHSHTIQRGIKSPKI